jgi:hypothetical protein
MQHPRTRPRHKVQLRFPFYHKIPHGNQSLTIENFFIEAMASSSIVPLIPLNPFLGQSTSEKLAKGNHVLWKAQILTVVRGACLEDFLTGAAKAPEQKIKESGIEVLNPLYEHWRATDQQVLGYLLLNMSMEAVLQVSICKTTTEVWSFIEATYSSIKKARLLNTRIALSNTKKGNMTISEYVGKMRVLADDMATSGSRWMKKM